MINRDPRLDNEYLILSPGSLYEVRTAMDLFARVQHHGPHWLGITIKPGQVLMYAGFKENSSSSLDDPPTICNFLAPDGRAYERNLSRHGRIFGYAGYYLKLVGNQNE